MIIDMHSHSVFSDDSRATVEQYAKWISKVVKRKGALDAIVLTEHRGFDKDGDYSELEEEYDIRIFKATELDTNRGHILLYGVNEYLLNKFDFTDVTMDAVSLVQEAKASGAFAVPAHPGRKRIGLREFVESGVSVPEVEVVEILNGGSSTAENERARELAEEKGYKGVGGSDAHFVNAIGKYATEFHNHVDSIEDLVEELKAGAFEPVRLEDLSSAP